MKNTNYTWPAISFHWLIAVGIFICFPVGMIMGELELSPLKLQLISYHKWLGVTIFGLLVLRIVWRSFNPPPALPSTMPKWQIGLSHATHLALYLLMIAIPVSGWLMSSAKGYTTVYLGMFPLPDLLDKDKALGHDLEELHEALNYILLLLVGLHIVAAIKHHIIDRDNILTRIAPWIKQK